VYIGVSIISPRATYQVRILSSQAFGGVAQPLYQGHDGRTWVAGVPGQAYVLEIQNLVSKRIEVINTVDGRNTMEDEPGDWERNRGLVFRRGETGRFTGWRVNDLEARDFVFGTPEQSVAGQAGEPRNIGVIGFAAYREQDIDPYERGMTRGVVPVGSTGAEYTTDMARTPATAGAAVASSIGTAAGEAHEDRVHRTRFIREYGAPDMVIVSYDTDAVLRQRGILDDLGVVAPQAFPGTVTGYGDQSKYPAPHPLA
jgi:hypothetical protein